MSDATVKMSAESLLQTFGLIGIFAVLFVETGLLVGFFLPGNSLLFVTGLAASGALSNVAGAELPLGPCWSARRSARSPGPRSATTSAPRSGGGCSAARTARNAYAEPNTSRFERLLLVT